jgi:ABC-type siderophore export system fused ATPase/permease subunit
LLPPLPLLLLCTVLLPSLASTLASTLASVALASLTLVASTSLALVVSPPLPLQPLLLLLLLLLLQPVATEYIQLVAIQIVDKPLYFLARRMCDELHSTHKQETSLTVKF